MTHLVFAQETAASPLPSLLFLGLMVAVFWLFIIRPQRQRAKPSKSCRRPSAPARRFGPSAGSMASWCLSTTRAWFFESRRKDPLSRKAVGSQVGPDKPEAESS